MADPSISILIVNWNSGDLLARCLSTLDPHAHDIIVIDNASADGSGGRARERFPTVRVLLHPTNAGFAGGVNLGAGLARGDYLLLLNPDTEASPGAVERLGEFLKTHEQYGAAGGHLVGRDGRWQRGFNVRGFPTVASLAADLLLVDTLWPGNPATRRHLASHLDEQTAADVDQPAGACLMIRAHAFRALGGMDERFHPAWFEDVDLCRRLRHAGWSIAYVPDATFVHSGGTALETLGLGGFSRVWYQNMYRYMRKHHGSVNALAIRSLVIVGMLIRVVGASLSAKLDAARAYLRVCSDAIKGWPDESGNVHGSP